MPFIQAFTPGARLRGWEKAPFTPPPFPCAIQQAAYISGKTANTAQGSGPAARR
jgi:hypothetical protein